MKFSKWFLLGYLALGLSAPGFAAENAKTLQEILGTETAVVLSSPQTVNSYRLGTMNMSPMAMPTFGQGKYVAGGPGPSLTAAQTKKLQRLLNKPLPFRSEPKANCRFNPGVALQFVKDGKALTLLFCFSCDEWAFDQGGKMVYAQFGSDRKALVELAKALFPQDEEIQKLN